MSKPHTGFQNILSITPDGVRLNVKARPGNNRARAPHIVAVGDNLYALEITVAAPPEDGKANMALCATLAEALHLPSSSFNIKTGNTSKLKVVEIRGANGELYNTLCAWLETL